jgi:DMSO/TMAO reductase YedYZ molybdopterin-dependent catalytic subunit
MDETTVPDESDVIETTPVEIEANEPTASTEAEVEERMRRMSRRSFLLGAVAIGSGYTGWRWLISRRDEDGLPWPLRRALQTNEELARDYFKASRLAPTFAKSQISPPRVNGDLGLGEDFNLAEWQLNVEGLASAEGVLTLSLQDIQALPRATMTTELKCIEGWSIIVQWAGARLADFIAKYPPATRSGEPLDIKNKPQDLPGYIGMSTPDGGYYVGLDMESALHPQTLLCYEMNGQPLTLEHGAPLRLAIPVKYGIKNIKRIGTISYANSRPADYWAEQGYDWYAGH